MTRFPKNVIMDWNVLHQLSEGDATFERQLMQMYCDDTVHHLGLLDTAIANRQGGDVAWAAHHIKGASANVGAQSMSQFAAILEQLANSANWAEIQGCYNQLNFHFQALQALVDATLA